MLDTMNDISTLSVEEVKFLKDWVDTPRQGKLEMGLKRKSFECLGVKQDIEGMLWYINDCVEQGVSAYQSITAGRSIFRMFFDFDKKSDIQTGYDSPDLDDMWESTTKLANQIIELGATPMIFYTGNRGFHVWVYLDQPSHWYYPEGTSEKEARKIDCYAKQIFRKMYEIVLDGKDLEGYDGMPSQLRGVSRTPYSIHHKTGLQVIALDMDRKPTTYDLDTIDRFGDWLNVKAKGIVRAENKRREIRKKKYRNFNNDLQREILPCLVEGMKAKIPNHYVRLAYLIELINKGKTNDEIHAEFSQTEDYKPDRVQAQIDNDREKIARDDLKPFKRVTLKKHGICTNCGFCGTTTEIPKSWRRNQK